MLFASTLDFRTCHPSQPRCTIPTLDIRTIHLCRSRSNKRATTFASTLDFRTCHPSQRRSNNCAALVCCTSVCRFCRYSSLPYAHAPFCNQTRQQRLRQCPYSATFGCNGSSVQNPTTDNRRHLFSFHLAAIRMCYVRFHTFASQACCLSPGRRGV